MIRFSVLTAAVLFVAACSPLLPYGGVELAVAPLCDAWALSLGEPEWSFRWIGPDGRPRRLDGACGKLVAELEKETATPVLAYPYWPGFGIGIARARPYGAVCPYGLRDGRLRLDPEGGVSASFFLALSAADGPGRTAPELFDWPRFTELLRSDSIPAALREDPWNADWAGIALKTRASGFDSRRLVPLVSAQAAVSATFAVPAPGPWASSSPFLPVTDWIAGDEVALGVGESDLTYFCAGGTLRVSGGTVAWFPLRPPGPSDRLAHRRLNSGGDACPNDRAGRTRPPRP